MANSELFEMHVEDVFHFTDGRTVFIGSITGGAKFIRRCRCELLLDGVVVQILEIEGEMIPSGQSATESRSVSTLEPVALTNENRIGHSCMLRQVEAI